MNLQSINQGEPWMTPDERTLNHNLVQSFANQLATAGVAETALIVLRVNDVVATWLLARRLESALVPAEGEAPPCPTPAQAGAIGKCRDRLRRAMKDLEASCKNSTPNRQGIADQLHETFGKIQAADKKSKSQSPTPSTSSTSSTPSTQSTPSTPSTSNPTPTPNPTKYRQCTIASAPPPRPRKYHPEKIPPNPNLRSTWVASHPDGPSPTNHAPDASSQPHRTPPHKTG